MHILETERLRLRQLVAGDAAFILELVNEPAFRQHLGDRNVRTLDQAQEHLLQGPAASYARHGFGLWLVELRKSDQPLGLCGLIRRDWLGEVELGACFLKRFWSRGHAHEAATGVLDYGHRVLGKDRVATLISERNQRGLRALAKLGFHFERMVTQPDGSKQRLFITNFEGSNLPLGT